MEKSSSLSKKISDAIRERGPLTVAAFMDLALYDPELGYYARAARRTGRAGDFFTSVDVGPIFGRLLEIQLAEMWALLGRRTFDLIEAGAGNGRLSADILRAAKGHDRAFYDDVRLHLVEASAAARSAQRETLGDVAGALESSSDALPESFEGVLVANELLDAMPVHQVVMREDGLREIYVTSGDARGREPTLEAERQSSDVPGVAVRPHALRIVDGPLSTSALEEYLDRAGARLEPGWRTEINLRAVAWVREASRRLRRGFIVFVDYGHEARELYSVTHSSGTLTTFVRHHSEGPESSNDRPAWLRHPGAQDITAHVDFTSVRAAAEAEGLTTLGFLDQTYFLLGLLTPPANLENQKNPESQENLENPDLKTRLALKTLLMPGGLGSTHKVLILGKNVGAPALRGCSYRMRVT
jgi:SAM-dependent MidA family methyltransferase